GQRVPSQPQHPARRTLARGRTWGFASGVVGRRLRGHLRRSDQTPPGPSGRAWCRQSSINRRERAAGTELDAYHELSAYTLSLGDRGGAQAIPAPGDHLRPQDSIAGRVAARGQLADLALLCVVRREREA